MPILPFKKMDEEFGQTPHERILTLYKSIPEIHGVCFGTGTPLHLEQDIQSLAMPKQSAENVLKYYNPSQIMKVRKMVAQTIKK
jgi:hypothetical protein